MINDKKKVQLNLVFVLQHFSIQLSENNTGTQAAVLGLSSALAEVGADVTVLAEGIEGSCFSIGKQYRIQCIAKSSLPIPNIINPLSFLRFAKSTPKETLFVLNGLMHVGMTFAGLILKLLRRRYVVITHNSLSKEFFVGRSALRKSIYFALLERRHLRNALAIQVYRQSEVDFLRGKDIFSPCVISPNGVDIPISRVSHQFSDESERPRAIFFGRVDLEVKGLDLLLAAWRRLDTNERPLLTIQGPASKDATDKLLSMITDLGLIKDVVLLGPDYVTPAPVILAAYDIFCLSSRREAFSLSAVQAMLAGCVILASSKAGVADHVASCKCGVVVEPSPQSISDGIHYLVRARRDWVEMGSAAQDYVLHSLTWPTIAGRWFHDVVEICHAN
jgi:glycosyltransferase involved in cell wall biosynthesis